MASDMTIGPGADVVWVIICDEPGQGMCAVSMMLHGQAFLMPLVTSSDRMKARFPEIAADLAKQGGRQVKIVEFRRGETIQTFDPPRVGS